MMEIWKEIDDRYSISNFGRVKSNYRNKDLVLKQRVVNGYLKVNLYKDKIMKSVSVHRLVAEAFIPNPDDLPEVNHKDENKENNYVDNLEWCTPKYNCNYGTRIDRISSKFQKRICSVDKNDIFEYFDSEVEAANKTGISRSSISSALTGYRRGHTAGGRLWFYNDENIEQIVKEIGAKPMTNKKAVYSVDTDGNIEHFISVSEAKRKTGANNIHYSIKHGTKSNGRRWFYEN